MRLREYSFPVVLYVVSAVTEFECRIHSFIYLAPVLLHLVTVDLSKFIHLQYIFFHKSVNHLQTY
jgi:hypothetical protein